LSKKESKPKIMKNNV